MVSVDYAVHGVRCRLGGDAAFLSGFAREHRPYQTGTSDDGTAVIIDGFVRDALPAIPDGAILIRRAGSFDRYQAGAQVWLTNPRSVWRVERRGGTVRCAGVAGSALDLLETARVLFEAGVAATMEGRGMVPLHAASAVTGRGGVLVVGDSGFGKTTLALALCRRGARLLADDTCFYDPAQGELYGFLPHLALYGSGDDGGRESYEYSSGVRRKLVDPSELGVPMAHESAHQATVIVQPVWNAAPTVTRLTRQQALRRLAPWIASGVKSFFRCEEAGRGVIEARLRALLPLVGDKPVYYLRSGPDADETGVLASSLVS